MLILPGNKIKTVKDIEKEIIGTEEFKYISSASLINCDCFIREKLYEIIDSVLSDGEAEINKDLLNDIGNAICFKVACLDTVDKENHYVARF